MVVSMNKKALPYVMGALILIPLGGTMYRLGEIILTGHWAFDFNPEIVDRLPLFLHGLGMVLFLVLGAFQFSTKQRIRNQARHRTLGRIAGFGAILGGVTGIWMTLLHVEISTPLLLIGRLFFGSAMAVFTVFAIRAAIQGRVSEHRAWIIRAYAIAINAGTFPLFYLPFILILGEPTPLVDEAFQVAGWMINLTIAEKYLIGDKRSVGVKI
ncbi:MAG: DUF2306 domain-containing protein [Paracoccaceae bacterium]|nr:DUF2306 domain-containing protein [Paracoccaceae bacterium]MDG1736538.1 DUF2306 domain-containing protein [Paracoccaceae bacterium]MDG2259022.1 DUF2306 domain-containing protein [Paracoccaceae bacterium]